MPRRKETLEKEIKHAARISDSAPWSSAGRRLAEAISCSRKHAVYLDGDNVILEYNNEYGPTRGVSWVIERMDMPGYKDAFDETVRLLLGDRFSEDMVYMSRYPTVSLVPERGSPIVRKAVISSQVPKHTYSALLSALEEAKR